MDSGRLKVLVFSTVYPSAARPVHGLFVAERARHAARRADVRVVAPAAWFRPQAADDGRAGWLPAVRPLFLHLPGLFKCLDGVFLFLSSLRCVSAIRRQFDFDLIDAHFGYPDGVAAILLGRWFRRPVTITLRGSELELARFRLRAAVMRWALPRADRIIALSAELAALAVRLGVDAARIEVIGNGVDLDLFRPRDRATARDALGIDQSASLIVAVGHLAAVKGFDLLIEHAAALATERPTLGVAIVGGAAATSGLYPVRLAEAITRAGLSDRVVVTGAVPPERVALWLAAADLFVLSSVREGSPNAVREALACGCPVVACDVGDVRQILHEDAGVIVTDRRNRELWLSVLRSALDRPWNRAAIRAQALRHAWDDVAERVVAQWRRCVDPGVPAGQARAAVELQSGDAA
jgi:glycosyltransferase involved in cell wall biosynthesis